MLLLMLVGVASASYPMFHCDEQRTGYVSEDGPQNNTILWIAETDEFADGSPAVHNGKVFVPTWPDMDPGKIGKMGLVCYDAATGEELWTNELGSAGVGSVSGAAIADGRVYLGGIDGKLYCVDEATGETLWESSQIDATGYFGLTSSPLAYEGKIYALSTSDGVLHAFDPDGTVAWIFETGDGVSLFTSPAGYDGKIYCAGNESQVFCIDPETQSAVWISNPGGSVKSSPVIGEDGTVYYTTDSLCCALDGTTGTELWNSSVAGTTATPALARGRIYAGASDGLRCLDASTGEEAWRFPAKGVTVAPVVAGDLAYIATNEETGTVYAVDAGTGDEVWSYTLDAPGGGAYAAFYASSPAVSDGVLYIGAENNRFYAFGEGSVSPTPTPVPTLWNGTVTLAKGETFTFTPSNNVSASYTINRTTDLGALSAAAEAGNFTFNASDAWYASYGSFMLDDIAGIANEDWTQENARSWSIFINGAAAPAGLGANTLADGDRLAFYYCPADPTTYAPLIDQAGYAVAITVSISTTPIPPVPTLWNGTVTLAKGETFTFTPSNNVSASYTINRTTDLGALSAAAEAGNFTFNASDAWYASYGSFMLDDIAGIANEDWTQENARSWSIFINGAAAPAGLGANTLADGDHLAFYYCPADPATYAPLIDQAGYAVAITISISTPGGNDGGDDSGSDSSPSWIPVTLESGTFNITAKNSKKIHTVDRQTALGALDATGIPYTIDDSYYLEYGSLFLNSIRGRANEGTSGWMYQVNGQSPAVGANTYTVTNGDEIIFFWSESMSSTPATSPDIVSIRVTIPTSSDSGSDSPDSNSDSPGTTSEGSGSSGTVPSFYLGLPIGAVVELGEWGQVFSFDVGRGSTSGEEVTISGNSFIIKRNGLTMVLDTQGINEKDGKATGLIKGVRAAIEPVSANIGTIGTVTASLDLNLTGIPGDGRIDISFNETPAPGVANAFHLAAVENGEEIDALAYTITVTRTNLENGEDIAGAVIRMSVSPAWVEEHGGIDAIRILRSAEDGTYQVLNTRVAGTDGNGNLIVEAISPGGLSVFGLLAVTPASVTQGAPASTAAATAAAVTDAPAAAGSPPPLSPQFIVAGAGAALLIGAVYLIARRRGQP